MLGILGDFHSEHEFVAIYASLVSPNHGCHPLIILEVISCPFPTGKLSQLSLDCIQYQWVCVLKSQSIKSNPHLFSISPDGFDLDVHVILVQIPDLVFGDCNAFS